LDTRFKIRVAKPARNLAGLARIIHKPRREVMEMAVMARKTSESTGGVSEVYVEDRRARLTPPTPASTTPQQRACE
jgi:hypothetical protein